MQIKDFWRFLILHEFLRNLVHSVSGKLFALTLHPMFEKGIHE